MKKKSNGQSVENSRRGEILAAAARLFREKGFDAATIRDITGMVGIASGSTFCHFKSKRDMLDAVAIEGMQHLLAEAEVIAQRPLSAEDRLLLLTRCHMAFLHDSPSRDFVAVLFYELRSLSPHAREAVMELMNRYEAIWQNCLGMISPCRPSSTNSNLLHRLLFGALNWTVQWYQPEDQPAPEFLAEEIASVLLWGIKAVPGREASL